ncbi:hypothetical protein PAXINDRAFT_14698 [Paxillus involutus ATCC 200175]|uniref:Uncharacterized protein n=1 Tax=Paxillus involutus ATCC 200175 TaxID=664439 RepID=A0A0C9TA31_PAXIN|nr:hypothetical protein PAXINDRAFT_14698 [Paxillus involutus ATCC 200175]
MVTTRSTNKHAHPGLPDRSLQRTREEVKAEKVEKSKKQKQLHKKQKDTINDIAQLENSILTQATEQGQNTQKPPGPPVTKKPRPRVIGPQPAAKVDNSGSGMGGAGASGRKCKRQGDNDVGDDETSESIERQGVSIKSRKDEKADPMAHKAIRRAQEAQKGTGKTTPTLNNGDVSQVELDGENSEDIIDGEAELRASQQDAQVESEGS